MHLRIPILFALIISLGSCNFLGNVNIAHPTTTSQSTEVVPKSTEDHRPTQTSKYQHTPEIPILTPTATVDKHITASDPPLKSQEAVRITTIHMINETAGWAIGQQSSQHDHILRTFDGGYTWIDISPPQPIARFDGMILNATAHFVNNDFAWVVYTQPRMRSIENVQIWYTSNGGVDWGASAPLPLTRLESFFDPEQFSFIDVKQGWLLVHVDAGMSHDYSELFSTKDGGVHWERVVDPHTDGIQSLHNTGIAFGNQQFGWVTKDNLGVLQETFLELTEDGGSSWKIHALPPPNDFDWQHEFNRCITSDPVFLSQRAGIVLVNCIVTIDSTTFDTKTMTYIYTTPDLGQSWQYAQLPTKVDSLLFLSDQLGWAFGREIYETTDGGLSWASIKSINWDGQFSFVDSLQGWAVARDSDELALVKTMDGGLTWLLIDPQVK